MTHTIKSVLKRKSVSYMKLFPVHVSYLGTIFFTYGLHAYLKRFTGKNCLNGGPQNETRN